MNHNHEWLFPCYCHLIFMMLLDFDLKCKWKAFCKLNLESLILFLWIEAIFKCSLKKKLTFNLKWNSRHHEWLYCPNREVQFRLFTIHQSKAPFTSLSFMLVILELPLPSKLKLCCGTKKRPRQQKTVRHIVRSSKLYLAEVTLKYPYGMTPHSLYCSSVLLCMRFTSFI